ncbi:MAG: hypothetical protein IPP42_01160 [Saprospiraceae bacterium]|nr:hypothetical protein [Saprospiraceae bacterium]
MHRLFINRHGSQIGWVWRGGRIKLATRVVSELECRPGLGSIAGDSNYYIIGSAWKQVYQIDSIILVL